MDGLRQAFMDELVASPSQGVQCSSEANDNLPLQPQYLFTLLKGDVNRDAGVGQFV